MSGGAQAFFRNRAARRSVSLMTRCQPGPRLRKCSMTSRSSRNDTSFLVGAFCGPRVRRYQATMSGWTSSAGRALAKSASVSSCVSGSLATPRRISASSSSVIVSSRRNAFRRAVRQPLSDCFDIFSHVAFLCLPQADHPDLVLPPRESKNVEAGINNSDCDRAELSIVLTIIDEENGICPFEAMGGAEIDPMYAEIRLALVLVPNIGLARVHGLYATPIRETRQIYCRYNMHRASDEALA